MIDRHVEEALDLRRVQVHRQHAVGAGAGDEVRDQLGGDRHAAFVFAILPGVAEVRHDGRDSLGAGPLATVDHDEQFHQVIVARRAGRLNEEHVAAADVLFDLAGVLAVGELPERHGGRLEVQMLANFIGQRGVRPAAENLQFAHHAGTTG